jgi:hypothetical protein
MNMKFNKILEKIILVAMFIATVGTGYIFFETIILKKLTYIGFFNSWQFPMLLAIFIDSAFYQHLSKF